MILDAINRIEKKGSVEFTALSYHTPQDATYVVVDKNFNYKVISKDRFSFNSKYVAMDFYSKLITLNKAVDLKKVIYSNNYLTFFCGNFKKLNMDIIDGYYKRLRVEEFNIYRCWIKENIFNIYKKTNASNIKIFFLTDIKEYIRLGKEYLENYILSNKTKINKEDYGTNIFINLNSKKPYLKTYSRKTKSPFYSSIEENIKCKYFNDILYSLLAKGYNTVYILENGELIPIKDGLLQRNVNNALFFVYRLNERGNLKFLDMSVIPKYRYLL